MKIDLPTDCGNSPRMVIVGEFTSMWSAGDVAGCEEWLTDDSRWARAGDPVHAGDPAAAWEGDTASATTPRVLERPVEPERVEVTAIVTHGRLAACDGYMVRDGQRIDFCHMIRFAGTTKKAKIAEIRTYFSESRTVQ